MAGAQRKDRSQTVSAGGEAAAVRRAEVEHLVNDIVDPCSGAAGVPIGLVDMGIVQSIAVRGDEVSMSLLPTFGGCLYVGLFEEEIRRRLKGLEWCRSVQLVSLSGREIWTEDLMRAGARARLARSRRRARVGLPLLPRGSGTHG